MGEDNVILDDFQDNENNLFGNQDILPTKTFLKIENEYEKKFGRLYKTFDVRFLKSKIWDSINIVQLKFFYIRFMRKIIK